MIAFVAALMVTLAFASGTLLALALSGWLGAEREALARRLETLARPSASTESKNGAMPSLADAELEGGWQERLWRPVRSWLALAGGRLTPTGTAARLRASLVRAGSPLGEGEFAGLRILSVIGFLLPSALLSLLMPSMLLRGALWGLAAVIGFALPDALLEQAVRRRQSQIRRALPDAIDLLVVSVEAGLGLDGALAKVTEKMHGPLPAELARAGQEARLGQTRAQSLREMAARLDVAELKTFVAALAQADGLGTSIARVLRAQSLMARAGRVQRVREQAARLPVTMLFPLVVFVFPAIFVVLLGPSLLRLMAALARMN